MEHSTVHAEVTPDGIPYLAPNTTLNGDCFYVSYNNYDIDLHGDVTTALVDNDMTKFYVLNGNHMDQYATLIEQGYDACLEYFKAHIDQIARYSNRL